MQSARLGRRQTDAAPQHACISSSRRCTSAKACVHLHLLPAADGLHAHGAAYRHRDHPLRLAVRYVHRSWQYPVAPDILCSYIHARAIRVVRILDRPVPVNALFYQFEESDLSVMSLARKIVIGVLTSVLVFIPTTAISVLFQRVRPRRPFVDYAKALALVDMGTLPYKATSATNTLARSATPGTPTTSDAIQPTDAAATTPAVASPDSPTSGATDKADASSDAAAASPHPHEDGAMGHDNKQDAEPQEQPAEVSDSSAAALTYASDAPEKTTSTIVLNDYHENRVKRQLSNYSLSGESIVSASGVQVSPSLGMRLPAGCLMPLANRSKWNPLMVGMQLN